MITQALTGRLGPSDGAVRKAAATALMHAAGKRRSRGHPGSHWTFWPWRRRRCCPRGSLHSIKTGQCPVCRRQIGSPSRLRPQSCLPTRTAFGLPSHRTTTPPCMRVLNWRPTGVVWPPPSRTAAHFGLPSAAEGRQWHRSGNRRQSGNAGRVNGQTWVLLMRPGGLHIPPSYHSQRCYFSQLGYRAICPTGHHSQQCHYLLLGQHVQPNSRASWATPPVADTGHLFSLATTASLVGAARGYRSPLDHRRRH